MRYGCYADGFQVDSHLADLFFLYFFLGFDVTFRGLVLRLALS